RHLGIDCGYSFVDAGAAWIGRSEVERLDRTTSIPLKDAFFRRVRVDDPVSHRFLACSASLIVSKKERFVFEHRPAEGSSKNILDKLWTRLAGLIREKVVRVQNGVAKIVERIAVKLIGSRTRD